MLCDLKKKNVILKNDLKTFVIELLFVYLSTIGIGKFKGIDSHWNEKYYFKVGMRTRNPYLSVHEASKFSCL